MKKICLIIPCYNEEDTIPIFYKEVTSVLGKIDYDYEVLFVDDGSKDKTIHVIRQLQKEDQHIQYLSFSRNFGKEAAMYAGFCNADGDYVAVMDADLQDPPALLPKMLKILEEGDYVSVATRRVDRQGEPPIRSFMARSFYKLINRLSEVEVADGARDYRLMKREMVDAIISMTEYNRFSKGIFAWVGFKTYWYPYENVERVAGESKWNVWKLLSYGIDGIMNFSQTVLDITSWMGISMTVFSFLCLVFIIVRKLLFGDPVAGWASTVCVIIFIGGIQLLCMGVMGKYLSKTYMESKNRPHFIVAEASKDSAVKIH